MSPRRRYEEATLPKWAQDLLRVERMRAREATERYDEQMARLAGDPEDETDTIIGSGYGDLVGHNEDYPLKPGQSVTFFLEESYNDRRAMVTVKVDTDRHAARYLVLYASDSTLNIRPKSGNTIEVRAGLRHEP